MLHQSSYQTRVVRAELILKGFTLSEVARRCNVTPAAVSRVVARHSSSRKIECEIARMLGRSRRELFPRIRWEVVMESLQSRLKGELHTKDVA